MGKKFPKQHEIDEQACRIFDSALPASWVCRPQLKDYGVDKEVEIFEEGKSTGIIFKVQVKGTEKPGFSSDDLIISFSLSVDDVGYYCEELKVPIVLVVIDVTTSKIWWHAIQLDSDLRKRLIKARQKKQSSITVHINSRNMLPKTLSSLLKKILESETLLSIRSISKTSIIHLMNSIVSEQDLDTILKGLDRSAAIVKSEKLARLWQSQDYTSIKNHIEEILKDKDSPVEVKYEAYLYAEKLAFLEARLAGEQHEYSKITYRISVLLKSISKGGPLHLRSYAALSLATAELDQYAKNDLYLFMNSMVHQKTNQKDYIEPLWSMMLPTARKKASVLVNRKYRQCHRLLNFMLKNNQYNIIPLSVDRVIGSMVSFLLRLRREGMSEAAKSYELSLKNLADIAIDIAVALKNWQEVSLLISNSALICNFHDDECIHFYRAWIEDKIKKIEDAQIQRETLLQTKEHFEKAKQLIIEDNKDKEDLDVEKQIYIGMAQSMGINLEDPDDKIAQIINIGLRDLNPTRVLKNCDKLYVSSSSSGVPARMLFLPTAGSKTLYCTLNGYGIGGLSLDSVYKMFKEEYCSKCKKESPHPRRWKWSRLWQQKQHKLHGEKFKS